MSRSNSDAVLDEIFMQAESLYVGHCQQWDACARTLLRGREMCRHGEWGKRLATTGIPSSTASRMVKMATYGIEISHVGNIGVDLCYRMLVAQDKRCRRILELKGQQDERELDLWLARGKSEADFDMLMTKYHATPADFAKEERAFTRDLISLMGELNDAKAIAEWQLEEWKAQPRTTPKLVRPDVAKHVTDALPGYLVDNRPGP